jgi:FKBP-type peptidyl-prolyl cis-trans isomerase SlyD
MQIAPQSVVSMHYTLTDDTGTVIDSSANADPLVYLQGAGNIIPGLENALLGLRAGDKLEVRVSPEEGYGVIIEELVQQVPVEMFQGVENIEPGMTFQAQDQSGYVQRVEVKSVDGGMVTIDANHPLAGQHLNFDVTIVEVRPATEEEIDHGHVHGPHGHHH